MTITESITSLTGEEISKATAYLLSTGDDLTKSTVGLSSEQLRFKPAPERWSIAEILEHLLIVEGRVHDRIRSLPEGTPSEQGRNDAEIDAFVLAKVPDRSERLSTPPAGRPSGEIDFNETLMPFDEARRQTIALLHTLTYLRGRTAVHPVLGPLDGYQWILAAGAHTARHLDQINEVKAHSGFPPN